MVHSSTQIAFDNMLTEAGMTFDSLKKDISSFCIKNGVTVRSIGPGSLLHKEKAVAAVRTKEGGACPDVETDTWKRVPSQLGLFSYTGTETGRPVLVYFPNVLPKEIQ